MFLPYDSPSFPKVVKDSRTSKLEFHRKRSREFQNHEAVHKASESKYVECIKKLLLGNRELRERDAKESAGMLFDLQRIIQAGKQASPATSLKSTGFNKNHTNCGFFGLFRSVRLLWKHGDDGVDLICNLSLPPVPRYDDELHGDDDYYLVTHRFWMR